MMYASRFLTRFGRSSQRTSFCLLRHPAPKGHTVFQKSIIGQRNIVSGMTSGGLLSQQTKLADSQAKPHPVRISRVATDNDTGMIEVEWVKGGNDRYPYIWMRDNCQCLDCYHASSNSRKLLIHQLHLDVYPILFTLNEEGTRLEIGWSDGHKGLCCSDWLQERSFGDANRKRRELTIRPHHTLWGSDYVKNIKRASFPEVLHDDHALLTFMQELEEYGLLILHDIPCKKGQVEIISNRVGFLKKTHYGDTFSVEQKVDANNLAFTVSALNLHTDFPYISYIPGVQVLHCISQTGGEGGDNLLVDSFNAAYQLQKLHPQKFEILTKLPVDFKDKGFEPKDGLQFYTRNQEPIINLNRDGAVSHVIFNQSTRDSVFNVPVEDVKDWYDAMLTYGQLLYHQDNFISYKMTGGDALVFDNSRVMHGRKAYHKNKGKRELEGCSWDWDMVRSCRRVLQERLGVK